MVEGPLLEHIRKYYNNEMDNIGARDSFVWYGPRWAQAATAPSRLYKLYTTEGGVRVPCISHFPKFQTGVKEAFTTVMDIAPTLLDMAGIKHPAPTYKGREVVPMHGESMYSWLEVYNAPLPIKWHQLTIAGQAKRRPWSGLRIWLGILWPSCHPAKPVESCIHPQTQRPRKVATLRSQQRSW